MVLLGWMTDGTKIQRGFGNIDGWCIHIVWQDGTDWVPRDSEYFEDLKILAGRHTPVKLYRDFKVIYDNTHRTFERRILYKIAWMSRQYGADKFLFESTMSILYAIMVAEENRAGTKLGKRMKRLAIYQLLFLDFKPVEAARYSDRKPWREIDGECRKYGF